MEFTDQLNRTIEISSIPQKIISLVPSQTELLFDLGLEEQIAGVTKFCVHPAHIRKSKPIIGGTKNLRIAEIKKIQPDLIIANKEENEQAQIEELALEFPVWISDIKNFDDALEMILQIGEITGKKNQAEKIHQKILEAKTNFTLRLNPKIQSEISTLYLIWKDPFMTIGGDTFISDLMRLAGFKNLYEKLERYPEINIRETVVLQPELILLSSEPYPFKENHISELRTIFPKSIIHLVDGEMFSWYGSRMLHCFEYFADLRDQLE